MGLYLSGASAIQVRMRLVQKAQISVQLPEPFIASFETFMHA